MRQGRRTFVVLTAGILLLLGVGIWLGHEPVLSWYYLRALARADEGEREQWADRVAGLDQAAVPALLDLLSRDDRTCTNARAGLTALVHRWGSGDVHTHDLARRLTERFARLGPAGQRQGLEFAADWLRDDAAVAPTPEVAHVLVRTLPEAARTTDRGVRAAALDLAALLMARPDAPEVVGFCRDLALACFADDDSDNRWRALHLALLPGMDLQQQALSLLRDPVAEVRQIAMLVVGPAQNVLSTDDLLHWLHDPDAEVRRLCEVSLSSRRMPQEHIRLGRTLTDPDHHVRLKVLDELRDPAAREIDAGIWLRYLTHDPKESVRVAAVRAAVEQRFNMPVDLRDRLEQMVRSDPSPAVRQEAGHYLTLIRE
jgi:hypothetical protein